MLRLALFSTLLIAASANAAETKIVGRAAHITFDNDIGHRSIVSVETVTDFGDDTLVLNVSSGQREYGRNEAFDGSSLGATWYRDWNDLLSTRTSLTASSDDPVFVNRIVDQDVTFRGVPNTTFTIGARYSEYYASAYSKAWYASAAYYLDRFSVRYRYTHQSLSDIGDAHANLLAFRLADASGGGITQLWLGQGTSIQDYDWAVQPLPGDYKSVALRRVQPLNEKWELHLGAEQSKHETAAVQYKGFGTNLGLAYAW